MSQKDNDVTFEIVLSPDLDTHLNSLIKDISDDDCDSILCSQQCISNEVAEKCDVIFSVSPSIKGDLRSSPELNEGKHLQNLQSCNESTEIKSSEDVEVKGGEKPVIGELFLDFSNKNTSVLLEISEDFSKHIINNSDEGSILKVPNITTHVTRTPDVKNNSKRKNTSDSISVGLDQSLYPSSSWPSDSNKLRKNKCQSHSKLAKINRRCDSESDFLKAEKFSVQDQELLLGGTESMPVLSHYSKAQEMEIAGEPLETGNYCSKLRSTSQVTLDVSQQKSAVEVPVTSEIVLDELVPSEDSKKIIGVHTIKESSVLLHMPTLDLKNAACSQPDALLLSSSGKSQPVNSLVSFQLNVPDLAQHALSQVSTLLPQELANQSEVNSMTLFSPLISNDHPASSELSPLLSHEASSLKEPRNTDLFSSPTSIRSGSLFGDTSSTTQNKEPPAQANKKSVTPSQNILSNEQPHEKWVEEEIPFTGNLPDTQCNGLHSKLVTNGPHADDILPSFSQSATVTPLCCKSFHKSGCLTQDETFADKIVKITHDLPSILEGSPAKVCERSGPPTCKISAKDTSPECVTSSLCSTVPELSQHRYQRHVIDNIGKFECEYQEMPRSPQMLLNIDGIPYSLPNADHVVPQCEETLGEKIKFSTKNLDSKPTNPENDHNCCLETTQTLSSEAGTLHSAVMDSDFLQNREASLSWPKIMSACTVHYQDSTRINLKISAILDDSKDDGTVSSTEETGNFLQHYVHKHVFSNEESTFSCEDTTTTEEHRVPDIETNEDVCHTEISLYNNCSENKQSEMKSKQQIKQAFQWNSVYETVMNKSLTDQPVTGDSAFDDLGSILPIVQSHRPLRVGLSRKQKVKHLHNKP